MLVSANSDVSPVQPKICAVVPPGVVARATGELKVEGEFKIPHLVNVLDACVGAAARPRRLRARSVGVRFRARRSDQQQRTNPACELVRMRRRVISGWALTWLLGARAVRHEKPTRDANAHAHLLARPRVNQNVLLIHSVSPMLQQLPTSLQALPDEL